MTYLNWAAKCSLAVDKKIQSSIDNWNNITKDDPFLKERSTKDKSSTSIKDLELSQDVNHTGGRKFDGGKLQYGLLPPNSLNDVVKVLTYGAEKYEIDNWKRVPEAKRRYFDAANRHIWAYKAGEVDDPETGVNHLAHAICCLMFINDLDTTGN